MADNDTAPKGDTASGDAKPCPAPRAGRRMLVLQVTGAVGALGLTGCVVVPAGNSGNYRAGMTDSDPNDGPGQGRGNRAPQQQRGYTGVSDSDPNDGAGRGRGGNRGTGVTDSDPNDGPGRGRGTSYRNTGRSDSDPTDGPGQGRGGNVRRTSDSDPYDAAGQGRR